MPKLIARRFWTRSVREDGAFFDARSAAQSSPSNTSSNEAETAKALPTTRSPANEPWPPYRAGIAGTFDTLRALMTFRVVALLGRASGIGCLAMAVAACSDSGDQTEAPQNSGGQTASTGGAEQGGAGGSPSGGAESGGAPAAGGQAMGGQATGGSDASGGTAPGGMGGVATGGVLVTGGTATGGDLGSAGAAGSDTGGASTGGASSGGANTGGAETGGTGSGGTGGSQNPDPDSDGDGISDSDEIAYGTDPNDADSDDDGLSDGAEDAIQNGTLDVGETDPLDPDSDDDGWCDGARYDAEADGLNPPDVCTGQEVVFVDASVADNAVQDGLSWATAFKTLQAGLAAAQGDQQIWIADGAYRPATSAAPSLGALASDVQLYGGFAGDEPSRALRPEPLLVSSITGDYLGNDVGTANRADNSTNVLTATGVTGVLVDGVTLRGAETGAIVDVQGGAEVTFNRVDLVESDFYGAILVDSATLVLTNSSVRTGVSGVSGGTDADITLDSVLFADNTGTALSTGTGQLTMDRVQFINNVSSSGAVQLGFTNVVARDVWFIRNGGGQGVLETSATTLDLARGVFIQNNTSPLRLWNGTHVIDRSVFVKNTGTTGGAIYLHDNTEVKNSTFVDNLASIGGAIYASPTWKSVKISNSTFLSNQATQGGALYTNFANPLISGCAFLNNSASAYGGAWYHSTSQSSTKLNNSAFWGNSAPQGPNVFLNSATFTPSNVCSPADIAGVGHVTPTVDPFQIVNANKGVFLGTASSCINAGNDSLAVDAAWSSQTTLSSGTVDASPVDVGVHHTTGGLVIEAFSASKSAVTWQTSGATACTLASTRTSNVTPVTLTGTLSHAYLSGTYYLICEGPGGPKVALAPIQ